jgi:hypothetical protein
MKEMKGIDTPGQALESRGFVPHFPPQGVGYLTLLSRHSLGNGTIKIIPFRSLRWGINTQG